MTAIAKASNKDKTSNKTIDPQCVNNFNNNFNKQY